MFSIFVSNLVKTKAIIKSRVKVKIVIIHSSKSIISFIKTLVKQRKESIEMYEKAGREALAIKEKLELDILSVYLPEIMDEGKTRKLVQAVITETNAKGLSDIGKVMPIVMQKGGSEINGKMANQILRELLE